MRLVHRIWNLRDTSLVPRPYTLRNKDRVASACTLWNVNKTIISIHRLTTSDDYQIFKAMAAVWVPYQCRCCGDVVLNHTQGRIQEF